MRATADDQTPQGLSSQTWRWAGEREREQASRRSGSYGTAAGDGERRGNGRRGSCARITGSEATAMAGAAMGATIAGTVEGAAMGAGSGAGGAIRRIRPRELFPARALDGRRIWWQCDNESQAQRQPLAWAARAAGRRLRQRGISGVRYARRGRRHRRSCSRRKRFSGDGEPVQSGRSVAGGETSRGARERGRDRVLWLGTASSMRRARSRWP